MKLNKILYICLIAASAASFTSCNDFLDRNRYPLDKQTDTPAYWESAENVEAQINGLYSNFLGYGNADSWVNNFYYRSINDDQCTKQVSGVGCVFANWEYEYAQETNTVWDASYQAIRKCNYIINNVENNSMATVTKEDYVGQAKLVRAMQYYELVRAFGDVQLIDKVLNTNSPELYGKRENRNKVMDFVLEDLNYAVEHIAQQSNKLEFSKDLANAMKSEICLFEASYAKYHQNDKVRANKFYDEVITACNALMGSYQLCENYKDLYISTFNTDNERGFKSLRENPEVIFMKGYELGILGSSIVTYISTGTEINGMNKDAFDAYLFKDGLPLAKTTCNTSDIPEVEYDNDGEPVALNISKALAERDGRLAQTIDPYLAFPGMTHARANSAPLTSSTGYTISKFANPNFTMTEATTDGRSFTCAPLYWLANIYLDYAEARAEKGELTDADINNTLNKLYKRAGLPDNRTVADLSAVNDPANNMPGVSSLLWEIRRCRRCELMFDQYHRFYDLVRWHQLEIMDTSKPENIDLILGANVSNAPSTLLSDISVTNGYLDAFKTIKATSPRKFTNREYLQPIGTTQIALNKNLTQNEGWDK